MHAEPRVLVGQEERDQEEGAEVALPEETGVATRFLERPTQTKGTPDNPVGIGWFDVDGIQRGFRNLSTQMEVVDRILPRALGKTVFDVGCAEGLIAIEFAKAGAVHVDGIELVRERVTLGKVLAGDLPVKLFRGSLENLHHAHTDPIGPMRMTYDITLALAIVHKVKVPDRLIRYLASFTKELLALRLPNPIIEDQRSNFRPIDPREVLEPDWEVLTEDRTSIKEYVVIFQRKS